MTDDRTPKFSHTIKRSVYMADDEARACLAAVRREAEYQRVLSGPLGDAPPTILIARISYFAHQHAAAVLDLVASRLEERVNRVIPDDIDPRHAEATDDDA